jgi:hypothetical protein
MFPSRRSVLAATAILSLVALISIYWLGVRRLYPTDEAALAEFYAGESRPECLITQPLEQQGSSVVPLIIRDLPNKTMSRRRYAIGFLGEGRYPEALPRLERILLDATEIDYFRADALAAIFKIAPTRAQALASQVTLQPQGQDRYQLLERTIKAVERGDGTDFVGPDC